MIIIIICNVLVVLLLFWPVVGNILPIKRVRVSDEVVAS